MLFRSWGSELKAMHAPARALDDQRSPRIVRLIRPHPEQVTETCSRPADSIRDVGVVDVGMPAGVGPPHYLDDEGLLRRKAEVLAPPTKRPEVR